MMGATVAAYDPRQSRGEIAICVWAFRRWHPMDIVTRGLGGSETAAYRLAEALSDRDYVVTLYGECEEGMLAPETPGHPHVMVRHWRTFDPTAKRLAVIAYRWPELFDSPLNAERKLLWTQDPGMGDRLTATRAEQVDNIVCVSKWHREYLAARYPFAARKLYTARNGITPSFFTQQPAPARQQRVLYTSGPGRGLDIVLEIWPAIRQAVPEAELVHTSAPVHNRILQDDPTASGFRERLRALADQPGVRSLSGLPQAELADLMRSSLVWAHPSYSTQDGDKFYETSCIGAMEAQAAGCCVVAANWGALPETVQVGTLISGEPDQQPWRDRFVGAIIAGLNDKRLQRDAQLKGPEIALSWDWGGVAEMVTALVTSPAVRRRRLVRWRSRLHVRGNRV